MKSKLQIRLESLIASAQSRLAIEMDPSQVRPGEYKAVCEERDIDLMEDLDKVGRLIDPEHPYYAGK